MPASAPRKNSASNCDECSHLGLSTPAIYDAPTPWGVWGFLCEPHYLRLPVELRLMGSELEERQRAEERHARFVRPRRAHRGVDEYNGDDLADQRREGEP